MMNTPKRKDDGRASRKTTPYSNRRHSSNGCFAPFKSPAASKTLTPKRDTQLNKVELAKQVLSLKDELDEVTKEIDTLHEEYSEDELQKHIDKLHEYNEIKDVAQMVLGRLAEVHGTTTRKMYEKFSLNEED